MIPQTRLTYWITVARDIFKQWSFLIFVTTYGNILFKIPAHNALFILYLSSHLVLDWTLSDFKHKGQTSPR